MDAYEQDGVIWVKHEGMCTGADALRICATLRTQLSNVTQPPILVHDARLLVTVDDQFVKHFMNFEREMGGSIRATLCIIPSLWLRMLAKAVGALSPGKWFFCNNTEEVHQKIALLVPSL